MKATIFGNRMRRIIDNANQALKYRLEITVSYCNLNIDGEPGKVMDTVKESTSNVLPENACNTKDTIVNWKEEVVSFISRVANKCWVSHNVHLLEAIFQGNQELEADVTPVWQESFIRKEDREKNVKINYEIKCEQ